MSNTKTFRSKRFDHVATYAFMAALWVPLIAMLAAPNRESTVENRQLAKFPGIDGAEISRAQLGNYLKDNLGFRGEFVRAHNAIKLAAFGSATTRKVVVGKDGWLFINMPGALPAYSGDIPLTDRIVSNWQTTLTQRADYLAKKDIPYGFIVVPDKHFVYSEYLPSGIARHPDGSYNEQLLSKLEKSFNVIQIFDALATSKKNGDLYYARDTHWNGRGAAAGYESILRQIGEFVPALKEECPCKYRVKVIEGSVRNNDLDRLIGSESANPQPKVFSFPQEAKSKIVATPEEYLDLEDEYRKRQRSVVVYDNPDERVRGRRIVMFHTSFTEGPLRTLLAEHFERAVFVRHPSKHMLAFHKLLIEREHPTLVINEIPTRYLALNPVTAYRTEEWKEEWKEAPTAISTGRSNKKR
ncbi:hypothetical protein ACFL2H_01595 [Planctomycetota bacterium]